MTFINSHVRRWGPHPFPDWGDGYTIIGEGHVATLVDSQQRPHFSLTATVYNDRGRDEGGGCMHEALVAIWPELSTLVTVHLSDAETGEPMHAVGNAVYWAGQARWTTKPDSPVMVPEISYKKPAPEGWAPEILARHLQLVGDDAITQVRHLRRRAVDLVTHGTTPATAWETLIEESALRALWRSQADAALALLDGAD